MRERVAIVFMTLNVMATLALGGAIAYDFSHRGGTTTPQPATAAVAGQAYTSPSAQQLEHGNAEQRADVRHADAAE